MTAQPDMTGFGRPPAAPTGFRKFAPFIATAATGGVIALIGLYAAQIVLPERFKPGYVAGTMAGSETAGHLNTSGDIQISYEARNLAAQQAVTASTQAMTGAMNLANDADWICGASRIGQTVAGKQRPSLDMGRGDAAWWQGLFRDIGDATCGVGSQVRSGIVGEISGNGHQSAMLGGRDVQQAPRTAAVQTIAEAFAIDRPSRHYSPEELAEARAYVKKLDHRTQDDIDHLLYDDEEGHDVFVERARAYAYLTNNH